MNLFELSAKISADTRDYEKAVKNATKVSKSLKDIMERSATQSETNKNKIKVLASEYSSAKAKVATLTTAFNKAAKEEGITAERTKQLAKELQAAEKESTDLKGQLDELTKKSKSAGDGFSKLGSALGKGLKTAAKVGTAAVGAAASGITALTKSAIDNYAEYEQLVGGVETLFAESADTVKKYADEAYKSAGLSANEYMSTVTGFSASLLQSLGRGAQTDLDALKENLDEQYNATKASWDDRIKLAKKFKQRNVDELVAQRDAELKALKKTNEQRLADAEAANNKSVVTAETQALAADLANQAVIDMADNAAKMG